MFDDERSLADVTPETAPAAEPVDVSEPVPAPEDFDMRQWLAGVRPTRRAIKLYPNAHLIAEMDRVVEEIDAAPADANVDDLIDEFESLRAQHQDGVWFVAEKRSDEWVEAERKRLIKALNLDADNEDDVLRLVYEITAAQIVSPRITGAELAELAKANEGEAIKLYSLVKAVNTQLSEQAGVLKRDFSSRRSVRR